MTNAMERKRRAAESVLQELGETQYRVLHRIGSFFFSKKDVLLA